MHVIFYTNISYDGSYEIIHSFYSSKPTGCCQEPLVINKLQGSTPGKRTRSQVGSEHAWHWTDRGQSGEKALWMSFTSYSPASSISLPGLAKNRNSGLVFSQVKLDPILSGRAVFCFSIKLVGKLLFHQTLARTREDD